VRFDISGVLQMPLWGMAGTICNDKVVELLQLPQPGNQKHEAPVNLNAGLNCQE
jgi:hypothetical protein